MRDREESGVAMFIVVSRTTVGGVQGDRYVDSRCEFSEHEGMESVVAFGLAKATHICEGNGNSPFGRKRGRRFRIDRRGLGIDGRPRGVRRRRHGGRHRWGKGWHHGDGRR